MNAPNTSEHPPCIAGLPQGTPDLPDLGASFLGLAGLSLSGEPRRTLLKTRTQSHARTLGLLSSLSIAFTLDYARPRVHNSRLLCEVLHFASVLAGLNRRLAAVDAMGTQISTDSRGALFETSFRRSVMSRHPMALALGTLHVTCLASASEPPADAPLLRDLAAMGARFSSVVAQMAIDLSSRVTAPEALRVIEDFGLMLHALEGALQSEVEEDLATVEHKHAHLFAQEQVAQVRTRLRTNVRTQYIRRGLKHDAFSPAVAHLGARALIAYNELVEHYGKQP